MSQKSEKLGIMLDNGVIPVIRARSADEALKVVEAIRKGGINTIEITMTVPGAMTPTEIVSAWEFIKAGASVISVGSALVDKKAVAQGQFKVLTRKAEQFVEEVKKARVLSRSLPR